jgi:hypothetical protein
MRGAGPFGAADEELLGRGDRRLHQQQEPEERGETHAA